MPRITGVLETILYADDLDAAQRFYTGALGLAVIGEASELMRKFRVATNQVLLVFDPSVSEPSGRLVPSHGARGPGHVALLIDGSEFVAWRDRLVAAGVAIEKETTWTRDGGNHRSIYVRDPADNSVELITGDIWVG